MTPSVDARVIDLPVPQLDGHEDVDRFAERWFA
jgi:hypothetical protein